MTTTVMKPTDLGGGWSNYSAMTRDQGINGGTGAQDGLLTRSELSEHIKKLAVQRKEYMESDLPTTGVDFQINDSRELYNQMVASGADALQYLPDEVMSLPSNLRRRATDLLKHDDVSGLGTIDQFVIDAARDRYAMLPTTMSTMTSKKIAEKEIDEIAKKLGLD